MESDSKRDRGEKGVKERTKILNHMIAKTDRTDNELWLPLWMHSYDTAGVMEYLYHNWVPPAAIKVICKDMGEEMGLKVCLFLAYCHDTAKMTYVFQSNISEGVKIIREAIIQEGIKLIDPKKLTNRISHSLCGEGILRKYGVPIGISVIVGSHHGKTPDECSDEIEEKIENYGKDVFFGQQRGKWEAIWKEWLDTALEKSGFSSVEELPDISMEAQVILTGLLIMADWIASNTYYFPLIKTDCLGKDTDYPKRVNNAIERLNLPEFWIPGENDWGMDDALFEERFGFLPREVQHTAMEIAQNTIEPGIFILEAQMGVGKTEAALAMAEILGQKAGSGGIFFGLPTQATANGLFPRLMKWAEQQSENVKLGIRLAHGAVALNEDYQQLIKGSALSVGEDEENNLVVHSWFEGRKVALLVDFVIGTIDQLLMAALNQRHVMLRHLGLAGKVVIIDEVHSYDSYMMTFLERILNWLGAYHVPVIVLSATLPQKYRFNLIQAYLNKRNMNASADWCNATGYPLFTWTDGKQVCQKQMRLDGKKEIVQVIRIKDEECMEILKNSLKDGGCAGIILNTVARAQDFAQKIVECFPECEMIQMHSQFIISDRAEIEREILKRAGKNSTSEQRNKLIIVGTQVLEQSLDIDFDVMITDLCPMDLLLQRIGREHRHGGRIRPFCLQLAKCYVLTETRAVYDEWLLQRTLDKLPEQFCLPDDIPVYVQKVYAEPEECEKNELWHRYDTNLKKLKKEAERSLVGEPACEDETNPEFDSIATWMSEGDPELTDASALASVRAGSPSIEVLVLRKKGDDICFLPWQYGGKRISADNIPSEEETKEILKQKLRLSSIFSNEYNYKPVLKKLRDDTDQYFAQWQYAPKLREELVLLLDENLCAELNKHHLHYDSKTGLSSRKEDKKK